MDILAGDTDETDEAVINKLMTLARRLNIPESIYQYAPQGFPTRLDQYLANISPVLQTTAGMRLKRIARLR
jgi:hypothetical protein